MFSNIVRSYFIRYITADKTLPKKCFIMNKNKYDNYHILSKICDCKYKCKLEKKPPLGIEPKSSAS